jgi:hypothetical protein
MLFLKHTLLKIGYKMKYAIIEVEEKSEGYIYPPYDTSIDYLKIKRILATGLSADDITGMTAAKLEAIKRPMRAASNGLFVIPMVPLSSFAKDSI